MESFPPTPVTKYGIELLKEGIEPNITYVSPDGEMAFYLNGGLAPWPGVTEGVVLAEGFEGLHPIFNHLDHRGARQDGASWVDTVYDPAEIQFDVICTARTPENLRKVIRKWFAAWDPQQTGLLSWTTPDGGEWWCYPRLFRSPPNKTERTYARSKQQTFSWSIRNDDAFWRSHDSVSQFEFGYESALDEFNRDDSGDLGPNWDQTYSGAGSGVCETDDGKAVWTRSGTDEREVVNRWLGANEVQTVTVHGSPTTWTLTYDGQTTGDISDPASAGDVQTALEALSNIAPGDVSVTGSSGGPYDVEFTGSLAQQNLPKMSGSASGLLTWVTVGKSVDGSAPTTDTDNQVVTARLGDFFEFPLGQGAAFDLWGRLDTAGTTGVRVRIGGGGLGIGDGITLSAFNGGVETELKSRALVPPSVWRETWKLVCGTSTDSRQFKVLRNGITVLQYKDTAAVTALGASYRGGGFGMKAGSGGSNQKVPPTARKWSMGDNAEITQSGHLKLTNFGDQEAFPDLVVYGPGTFFFGDGPGTEPTIEFGPLFDNQVALIKTHPGKRSVYDISMEPSETDTSRFRNFLQRLVTLAFNKNIDKLVDWFESTFGVTPQQGVLYSLLKGRWSHGVPPRGLTELPTTSEIAVKIVNGSADSKVIAALTPLRRWPE